MNHSRTAPNIEMRRVVDAENNPHVCFFALHDIAPGSELLFDYGERDSSIIEENPWLLL